MRGEVPKWP